MFFLPGLQTDSVGWVMADEMIAAWQYYSLADPPSQYEIDLEMFDYVIEPYLSYAVNTLPPKYAPKQALPLQA